ncbi:MULTISPECIES: sensor histidine kinase [Phyllobacteriaceae]|nr:MULTISPECIES: sensor histidine kinase [Mesorhizobium]MBN9237878.1 sensor histidine kinase N-terminal domain-containing protein [Mesorhizobium sp.]MDQ0328297.1 two-component system sensor histidine kinase TctE [Mesorhizobium sp. YL-MeA3-2017]
MAGRSLQRELLAWLIVPMAAVVVFNVWTTYKGALDTANLITDRTLLASARVIAERVRKSDGLVEAPIPPSALEMFASSDQDLVLYRVATSDGLLLAGYPDIVAPPQLPVGLEPLYFDTLFRGTPVRAVVLSRPIIDTGNQQTAIIAVGETLKNRNRLVTDLWLKALRDQVLLVAAAGMLAVFGLRRGIAPLMRLRDEVVSRDPAELQPFDAGAVQTEVRPLVEALNEAFDRVQRLIATQRRFVANAAHQLRTPLALLKTQIVVGRREQGTEAKEEALAAIDRSVDRMARLSNQLLSLARAEQGVSSLRKEAVDMEMAARNALDTLALAAVDRDIDLGFDPVGGPFLVWGHSNLLRELVFNLADNALRYTPRGGAVTVRLEHQAGEVVLLVEDNGPGIPATERENVFERFYRRLDTGGEGTGLGLAIVKEIAASHEATIELKDRAQGPGLVVEVRLAAHEEGAAEG